MYSKWFIVFALCCSTLWPACKKGKKGIAFHIRYNEEIVVQSQSVINIPINFLTPDVPTNSEEEFSNNDTRADKVQSIKLAELTLTITSPSGKTFSFLKEAHIYIVADGLPETEIAYATNVQSNETVLHMTTTDNDFSEYIKKQKYTIKTTTTTKENITQDIHMNAYMDFLVRATVL